LKDEKEINIDEAQAQPEKAIAAKDCANDENIMCN